MVLRQSPSSLIDAADTPAIHVDDLESQGTGEFLDGLVPDQNETGAPEQSTLRREVRTTIQEVIETELTEKQRRALVFTPCQFYQQVDTHCAVGGGKSVEPRS